MYFLADLKSRYLIVEHSCQVVSSSFFWPIPNWGSPQQINCPQGIICVLLANQAWESDFMILIFDLAQAFLCPTPSQTQPYPFIQTLDRQLVMRCLVHAHWLGGKRATGCYILEIPRNYMTSVFKMKQFFFACLFLPINVQCRFFWMCCSG